CQHSYRRPDWLSTQLTICPTSVVARHSDGSSLQLGAPPEPPAAPVELAAMPAAPPWPPPWLAAVARLSSSPQPPEPAASSNEAAARAVARAGWVSGRAAEPRPARLSFAWLRLALRDRVARCCSWLGMVMAPDALPPRRRCRRRWAGRRRRCPPVGRRFAIEPPPRTRPCRRR